MTCHILVTKPFKVNGHMYFLSHSQCWIYHILLNHSQQWKNLKLQF